MTDGELVRLGVYTMLTSQPFYLLIYLTLTRDFVSGRGTHQCVSYDTPYVYDKLPSEEYKLIKVINY